MFAIVLAHSRSRIDLLTLYDQPFAFFPTEDEGNSTHIHECACYHHVFLQYTPLIPGVDSASNRNEYQEYFLGGKGGRCLHLKILPPSCADCLEIWESQPPGTPRTCQSHVPIVLKSGSLSLPEPSGLVKACNKIAILLHLHAPHINLTIYILFHKLSIIQFLLAGFQMHTSRKVASKSRFLHFSSLIFRFIF
jgi:hypothetical protein